VIFNKNVKYLKMEEQKNVNPEDNSTLTEKITKEDPLKEIKKRFSRQTKTYPETEWWDWDSD
jgi:hypothetical protein